MMRALAVTIRRCDALQQPELGKTARVPSLPGRKSWRKRRPHDATFCVKIHKLLPRAPKMNQPIAG